MVEDNRLGDAGTPILVEMLVPSFVMMWFMAVPSVFLGEARVGCEAAAFVPMRGRLGAAAMLAIPTRTRRREFATGISLLFDM